MSPNSLEKYIGNGNFTSTILKNICFKRIKMV